MQDWIKVTLLLCMFGTLREIRPSEPFVTEFLSGEWRNVTEEQLNRDVYPVGTYSYLAQLVVIFLITDFLRFKPVIILSGLSGIAVYCILLWTESLEWLQASQLFYGTYIATEVAYLTYIYAKVDSGKYPRVSSYTRIAALAAQILATFWACWLPQVQYGIYFHRRSSVINAAPLDKLQKQDPKRTFRTNLAEASSLIFQHARSAYSRPKVLAWSALYAGALALFVQAQTYVQLLWKQIQETSDAPVAYNGAVEAMQTLLGAVGAFLASLYSGHSLPAPVAAVQAVAVFLSTYIPNIYVSYAGYIVLGMLFHYTITLASVGTIASLYSGHSLPAPVAAVQAVAVFLSTYIPNIYVSYAGYIVLGMLFHYTITLASLPAPVAAVQAVAVFLSTYIPNIYVSYAGYIVLGMLFHYTITLAR
ncbi:reduced folate carrier domain-containing protein [Phthorimaea operculella]|nr:reduced folate carrier domain-containing protein [Phthorimaea operculella]